MVEGLHLSPRHRVEIVALLHKHLPGVEVWAYGSRVNGRSHDGSDLDLVLRGPRLAKIDASQLAEITESFRESSVPFLIEAHDWARLPESFHRAIEREHVVLAEVAQDGRSEGIEKENAVVRKGAKDKQTKEDKWRAIPFARLLAEPVRNGIYKKKEFHGRGVKIVNMGELFAYPRLRNVHMKRVELSEQEKHRVSVLKGDLLFARRSLVAEGAGKCSAVLEADEPTTFESSIIRARPDLTKADPLFLYYYFNSSLGLHALDSIRRQVAVAGITGSDLVQLDILSPPLPEQRAISHILGTLDDKIELNRRMNETLEAMAHALFKSWFVDFDPVRAKMAGRDTGLPQHLADLFPDRLVNSELGEIPEGWDVESLEMIAQLEKATVKPEDHATEEFEHFSLPAYDSGQLPALDLGSTIKSNKTLVPSQAVLLSKLNPEIQRVWLPASASSRRQISSTEFLVFTPKPPIGRAGLYALFNTQSFRDLLKAMVTGTSKSHQRVAPKSLVTQGMISPADRLTNEFEALAWPMLERTLRNKSENHTLAALRDTLLPKLISGELRAKQVEAIA